MRRWRGRRAMLPDDLAVSVGRQAEAWAHGVCSYAVTVCASGPVRLVYGLDDPAGPTWLRQVPVAEDRRAEVLGAVLASGALAMPGGGDRSRSDSWLHVAGGGRSVWRPLNGDRQIGGWPVFNLVAGLVPEVVWHELHGYRLVAAEELRAQRAERARLRALGAGDRSGPDPETAQPARPGELGGQVEATMRDGWVAGVWYGDALGAQRPAQRPAERPAQAEGWPGIRHGGTWDGGIWGAQGGAR